VIAEEIVLATASAASRSSDAPTKEQNGDLQTAVEGLQRQARDLFCPASLAKLIPFGLRGSEANQAAGAVSRRGAAENALAATEAIALDFLCRGGKYARPTITLAAYWAACDGAGADFLANMPIEAKRVALAIEAFHKASLVHDDIEDDDGFRYGRKTLHREHGVATAINVGDYLIGLGYRLVSQSDTSIDAASLLDITRCMAGAHRRLTEGQGAELAWRGGEFGCLSLDDTLEIYALKTAPAFEAALYSGVRLAHPANLLAETIRRFARELGIGFQILNDLGDWRQDEDNKLTAGGDVLGYRPTLLLALALKTLPPVDAREMLAILTKPDHRTPVKIELIERFYLQAGVFDAARKLVSDCRVRANSIADGVKHQRLRGLLRYLAGRVLQPSS
jgi:geranylgeranyl diphosphate synthase type II